MDNLQVGMKTLEIFVQIQSTIVCYNRKTPSNRMRTCKATIYTSFSDAKTSSILGVEGVSNTYILGHFMNIHHR